METTKIPTADYLDILFEGRNKLYGGYILRKNYQPRVLLSGLLVLLIIGGLFASTLLSKRQSGKSLVVNPPSMLIVTLYPEVKTPSPETIPPTKTKSTEKFTSPVIRKNDEVLEEDKPGIVKPEENIVVGPKRINGSDDPRAMTPDLNRGRPGNGEIKPGREEPEHAFLTVQQMPEFPGGKEALARYLSSHIIYPQAAKEAQIQGKIYIRFIIDQNGNVTGAQLMNDIGGGCGTEALRVVNDMPKWKAGKQNGQAVRVYYTLPLTFRLQE